MASLLTEDEKARIRHEELFRAEVRRELFPPTEPPQLPNTKDRIWKFLNSTFGIWLLSTVVVASVAHVYNANQAAQRAEEVAEAARVAEEERHKEAYQRIALEISFRLSTTMARLKAVSDKYGQRRDAETQSAIVRAFEPLNKPASDANPPLYPEYKFYSGLALIAELQNHTNKPEREENLRPILAKASGWVEESVSDKPFPSETAEIIAATLLRKIYYENWSHNGFPYTRFCEDKTKTFC